MKIRTGLIAAFGAMMIAGNAAAADLTPIAPPPPPPPPAAPAFDWSGPYVGAYGGYWFCCGGMVGGIAGYNYQANNLVLGIDVTAGFYDFTSFNFEAYAIFRAGFAFDRVLAYGGIGPGWDAGLTYAATAGIEVAATDSLILRGEAIFFEPFAGPTIGLRGGVTFKFGGM